MNLFGIQKAVRVLGAVLLLGSLLGCTTYYGDARSRQMTQEREDMLLVREEIRRLDGRVEGLEMQSESLRDEINFTQRDQSRTVEDQLSGLQKRIGDLERRLDSLEANRQKDKQDIIDTLTGTISTIVKKTGGSSTPRPRTRKPSSEYVYEHEVGPGQTLSEIAKEYGVTVQSIIDENHIENPNQLRVGQVLYIPE